jgi:Ca2+-binding RTX toxin-like protein
MFNAFVDIGGPSKFGSWGALRHLDDSNPRHDALMAFNAGNPAWWENRPSDTFTQGEMIAGSPGADVLAGTVKADLLLAGQGDDILIASGAGDRLHGGAGDDLAYLPGPRAAYQVARDGDLWRLTANTGSIWLYAVETVIFWDQADQRFAIADLQ